MEPKWNPGRPLPRGYALLALSHNPKLAASAKTRMVKRVNEEKEGLDSAIHRARAELNSGGLGVSKTQPLQISTASEEINTLQTNTNHSLDRDLIAGSIWKGNVVFLLS